MRNTINDDVYDEWILKLSRLFRRLSAEVIDEHDFIRGIERLIIDETGDWTLLDYESEMNKNKI